MHQPFCYVIREDMKLQSAVYNVLYPTVNGVTRPSFERGRAGDRDNSSLTRLNPLGKVENFGKVEEHIQVLWTSDNDNRPHRDGTSCPKSGT